MGEIAAYIKKDKENVFAAEKMIKEGLNAIAVSRLYYAMFYAVEAILLTKKKSFSSHKAVISYFGKEFCKNNIIDAKFHRMLLEMFEARQEADYDPIVEISDEEVKFYVKSVKEFLKEAERHLNLRG